jgi:hypothetical protein
MKDEILILLTILLIILFHDEPDLLDATIHWLLK